ncbi:MAG TPA: DUF3048 domain-containing protein [Anaerolineales bacterium]|jgi:hypothetical protein|nr:DUF3048 domain-containing protein [Anaerolineales bacterium]
MRLHRFKILSILLIIFVSSCDIQPTDVAFRGIASPTPFQPLTEDASDSPFTGAAPTPLNLPTFTPLPPTPTERVIVPELMPAGISVPAFTLPKDLNPLTGLPPSDPALMERRPLAIKVANYPRYNRPQFGLTLADNVYEYYIEGGLTRFIAVFYGNDSEWVGPVRSGRYFDEHIQRMYHAYLVFKFADPRVETHLETTSDVAPFLVVPSIGSCPPFRLKPDRDVEAYNNSYFNTILWADCVAKNGLENERPLIRNGFFSEMSPTSELQGTRMYTYYSVDSYNYWDYDPQTKQYIRYQELSDTRSDKPESYDVLLDSATGEAVHAANVVFMLVHHNFSNTFDEEDEVYQIDLVDSGEAYVFRDGVGIPARWIRTNKDQPLLLTTVNGAPIYLRPGITFYQVLGAASYVDQDAGEWNFHHSTP